MIDINSVPVISKDVVTRKILDECLLVPIHHTAKDVDSIYTLNETAAFIWECIDGKTPISRIIALMVDNFDVAEEDAVEDALTLIKDLEGLNIVDL